MLPPISPMLLLLGLFCLPSISALQCYTGTLNYGRRHLVRGECYIYNRDSRCATNYTSAFCAPSTDCHRREVSCCDGNLCNNEHIDKEYHVPVQRVITNVKEYEPKTPRDERPPPVVPHRHHVRSDTVYHAALKCYTGYFEKKLTVERCHHTHSHCAVDEHRAYCASSTVCSRDNVYCCDRSMCNRERLNGSSSGSSIITALFTLLCYRIFG